MRNGIKKVCTWSFKFHLVDCAPGLYTIFLYHVFITWFHMFDKTLAIVILTPWVMPICGWLSPPKGNDHISHWQSPYGLHVSPTTDSAWTKLWSRDCHGFSNSSHGCYDLECLQSVWVERIMCPLPLRGGYASARELDWQLHVQWWSQIHPNSIFIQNQTSLSIIQHCFQVKIVFWGRERDIDIFIP